LRQILAEREQEMRTRRRPNLLAVLAVLIVVEAVIVAAAWAAFAATHSAGAPPYVVVSTPATYGTPGPAGGPR
jgi:hypothetical protein